jgi:hypothetical protein
MSAAVEHRASVVCGNCMDEVATVSGATVDDLHAQTFGGMHCERRACAGKDCLRLRMLEEDS